MSLDNLNRFVMNPTNLEISRSRFHRPFTHKLTFKSGDLVPVFIDEVLPGDTFDVNVNSLVRMLTPSVPVMDNLFMDLYFFFVPNRIATMQPNDWQKIIANENYSGYWAPNTESTLENTGNTFKIEDIGNVSSQSAMNYLGLPIGNVSSSISQDLPISRLPINGYIKIWNEFFRDQNTQPPFDLGDYDVLATECLKGNKLHDYFTSCLPSPQKGQSVLLPLGDEAPVYLSLANSVGTSSSANATVTVQPNGTNILDTFRVVNGSSSSNGQFKVDLSTSTSATINQLRQAFAIQRMLEKDARGGSRFRESLRTHFGVSDYPDATAQVPQYLAGKRIPLNITQVLQTSQSTESSPLGALGAFSNTFDSERMFIKSFTEHGYLYCLACVRPVQSYSQGIMPHWTRNRRFDWYFPAFANLGEKPVYTRELYAGSGVDVSDVFGYQEAWAEYRYHPSQVSGAFAPNANDNIYAQWTYTSRFNAKPILNSSFMVQDSDQIGNSLVIPDSEQQFYADFYFSVTTTRPMPLFSIPGLIDHN